MKHGSAVGIVSCIKESFQAINIMKESYEKKLVGFAADGASVNRGGKEGVICILKGRQPWVIYVWCVAHRLELSLKDALQGTVFDDVDEVLLRLYYLYENYPRNSGSFGSFTTFTVRPLNLKREGFGQNELVVIIIVLVFYCYYVTTLIR